MSSAQAMAAAANSASHPYTCNTCQVAYRNIELQKGHMKSDWHRYNLKRRVASLPPISADVFTEKVLQARAATSAEADKAMFERACEVCQKTYYSENAYHNHLSSQKHKAKAKVAEGESQPAKADDEARSVISSTFSLGDPIPSEKKEVDSDAEEEFNQVVEGLQKAQISQQRPSPVKRPSNPQPAENQSAEEADAANDRGSNSTTPVQNEPAWTPESCLFCNYTSPSVQLNANHMERFHGMFVPEKKYLVDIDGLLKQLQEKVRDAHACLFCHKVKSTVFAVQTHMRDTGHCKIPFETEEDQLEIGDYYDFRSTYSDGDDMPDDDSEADQANGGAKLGAKREAKFVGEDGKEIGDDEDGEGWETDSSASSLDSEDLSAVPAEGHIHQYERLGKHPHHSRQNPRHRHQADGWHSHAHKHTHAVFYDEYELHLPSGKSVGHRSLNKYFRQNLHNYPTEEERAERLAIEGGEAESSDGDNRVARCGERGRGREVVPRGASGMLGVTTQQKRDVQKSEQKGRDKRLVDTKRNDYMYGKKLNKQKTYYYRYLNGG